MSHFDFADGKKEKEEESGAIEWSVFLSARLLWSHSHSLFLYLSHSSLVVGRRDHRHMRSILAGVMLAARATLLTGATLPLDFGLGSDGGGGGGGE